MKFQTSLFTIVSLCILPRLAAAQTDAARAAWQQTQYRFTPQVEAVFLDGAKATVMQSQCQGFVSFLAARGIGCILAAANCEIKKPRPSS